MFKKLSGKLVAISQPNQHLICDAEVVLAEAANVAERTQPVSCSAAVRIEDRINRSTLQQDVVTGSFIQPSCVSCNTDVDQTALDRKDINSFSSCCLEQLTGAKPEGSCLTYCLHQNQPNMTSVCLQEK